MRKQPPAKILENIDRLLKELSKTIKIEQAFLFGSYAKGTWLKTSDVDLVVVSSDFEGMNFGDRLDLVNRVAWRLRISPSVEPLAYTPREFEQKVLSSAVLADASRYWVQLV